MEGIGWREFGFSRTCPDALRRKKITMKKALGNENIRIKQDVYFLVSRSVF